MIVHLQLFGSELEDFPTNRVTMLEDGTEYHIPGRILILGTKPDAKIFPLLEVQWFFVEEE